MHHTYYSDNLRNTQHKTLKKLSQDAISSNKVDDKSTDLLKAAVAAVLVLFALFQMDPANAQPTMDVGGYGTLQLVGANKSTPATAVNSELKIVIYDDQLNLSVDQTFSNPTEDLHSTEYWFALPAHAQVTYWQIDLENCFVTDYDTENNCHAVTTSHVGTKATRTSNRLLIATPAISAHQRMRVHLNIAFPTATQLLPATANLPMPDNNSAEIFNNASLAVTSTDLRKSITAFEQPHQL